MVTHPYKPAQSVKYRSLLISAEKNQLQFFNGDKSAAGPDQRFHVQLKH